MRTVLSLVWVVFVKTPAASARGAATGCDSGTHSCAPRKSQPKRCTAHPEPVGNCAELKQQDKLIASNARASSLSPGSQLEGLRTGLA